MASRAVYARVPGMSRASRMDRGTLVNVAPVSTSGSNSWNL